MPPRLPGVPAPKLVARAAALLGTAALLAVQWAALPVLAAAAPPGTPAGPPGGAAPNQLMAIVFARGIKATPLFGAGAVTPVEPTTVFINTDLPYAIVKTKRLVPGTAVTFRLADPTGPAFTIEVTVPPHKDKPWEAFDIALPLFILGTDLERRTGTWHLAVLFNGEPEQEAAFEWHEATPLALSGIKDAVDRTPTDADLRWRYGAALALLHHDREGIEQLQMAINLDSRYALYYVTLGRIYEGEGRTAEAIRAFRTALGLHGSFYDSVYSGWAQAHLAKLHAQ